MTVSEITVQDLADYIRLAEVSSEDETFLTMALNVAKAYIESYTGIDSEDVDDYVDLAIVVFVLVQDMYDTRSMTIDSDKPNLVVETILGMHSRNLL